MLLTTDHLLALDTLAASEAAGHVLYTIAEDAHTQNLFRVLELQGLVVPEAVESYRLTYLGYEVLRLLGKMQAAGLLPRNDAAGEYPQLKAGWRFLSSEVLAALEAASRNGGRVGPLTEELLSMRGFTEAETSHDEEQQRSSLRLNMHGEAWLSFARRARPQLEINGDLAHAIQHMNPGYTDMHQLGMRPEHLALLEAMELLSWSVPDGEFATLTALGWAVYEAVLKGGYATADVVLDEPILDVLTFAEKRGKASLTSEQLGELQNLGYVDEDGSITVAGQAALQASHWLHQEVPGQSVAFAITEEEVELLAAIQRLEQQDGGKGSTEVPSKANLHRVLIERLAESYKELIRRYGRTIEDSARVVRKRQAQAVLNLLKERDQEFNLKDREHWFKEVMNIDELLVGLESLGLVQSESEEGTTLYRLTPQGLAVLGEQGETPRDIRATAVKATTAIPGRFSGLATAWIEQSREEGLLGTGGITQSGHLYAQLAAHGNRWTTLTQLEVQTLVHLPEVDVDMLEGSAKPDVTTQEEKLAWALDKLETRGLIERLVDGQIVRTEAGQLLARAVSDALELAEPVTPAIVRLLTAIHQVGTTLYVKEPKVRLAPHQWAEVERLAGLEPDAFQEAVYVARLGHYIGDANINEAGLNLLAALAKLQAKI